MQLDFSWKSAKNCRELHLKNWRQKSELKLLFLAAESPVYLNGNLMQSRFVAHI